MKAASVLALVGAVVADAGTGEVLYDHNGDKRAVPGSNDKLFATAAALAPA